MSSILERFKQGIKKFTNNSVVPESLANVRDNTEIVIDSKSNTKEDTDLMTLDENKLESFDITIENENNTSRALCQTRDIESFEKIYGMEKIYYITDLHLMHKLKKFNVKTNEDIIKVIENTLDTIFKESGFMLLIGGDISSDFNIFEIFINLLHKRNHDYSKSGHFTHIFFVLGNHELWDFPKEKIDAIVEKYKQLIKKYRMHLIHNELFISEDYWTFKKASMNNVLSASKSEIREYLRLAKILIIGGIGFSGYNNEFNANYGIYRSTINREQEIQESDNFNTFYTKIVEAIPDKRVIVFTHMPMSCWREKEDYQSGYIYVSGHTHKNYFYDDGETRIYADNQIGYKNNSPYVKWFEYDTLIDYFSDYEDGIYEITRDDYIKFNRGKGQYPQFNTKYDVLYMLKKKGYYSFIVSSNGNLSILEGGRKSRLYGHEIGYYYDNMDLVVSKIKEPLDKYTSFQKNISKEIRRIGGDGRIHGCIIDINFYFHLYVNPEDYKITGYWAEDMKNKIVYPTINLLLKDANIEMYQKFNELSENLPTLYNDRGNNEITSPQFYFETDIYRASRALCKMQRLNSNILTVWIDPKALNGLIASKL